MNQAQALSIVTPLVELLRPACEQIRVAGSLRRESDSINDLEIVALPKWDRDPLLFPPKVVTHCALDKVWLDGIRSGAWREGGAHKANGPRYKRLIVPTGCGPVYSSLGNMPKVAVDLFLTDAANFGNILLIRTGNQEFSKACVTRFGNLGLLPNCYKHKDGYLWRITPGQPDSRIFCPSEEEYFRILGIAPVPPSERTLGKVMQLKARQA